MKYFFFFNSFISTSPSQPPILINFFLLGLSSYCVKFAAKTEEDLEIEFFYVYLSKEKTKNHNRGLIPSFSIKKKKQETKYFYHHIWLFRPPPVRYIEKIYISLSILSMFFCISCVTNKVTCPFQKYVSSTTYLCSSWVLIQFELNHSTQIEISIPLANLLAETNLNEGHNGLELFLKMHLLLYPSFGVTK